VTKFDGPSTTAGGVLNGKIGTAVATGDFALGVGWGSTASAAVRSGSTQQRGVLTITSGGTGQAQATATVVFTFPDGACTSAPFFYVQVTSTSAIDEGHVVVVDTTTTSTWTFSVLPVTAKVYTLRYWSAI
jgi:hypothetical protein